VTRGGGEKKGIPEKKGKGKEKKERRPVVLTAASIVFLKGGARREGLRGKKEKGCGVLRAVYLPDGTTKEGGRGRKGEKRGKKIERVFIFRKDFSPMALEKTEEKKGGVLPSCHYTTQMEGRRGQRGTEKGGKGGRYENRNGLSELEFPRGAGCFKNKGGGKRKNRPRKKEGELLRGQLR